MSMATPVSAVSPTSPAAAAGPALPSDLWKREFLKRIPPSERKGILDTFDKVTKDDEGNLALLRRHHLRDLAFTCWIGRRSEAIVAATILKAHCEGTDDEWVTADHLQRLAVFVQDPLEAVTIPCNPEGIASLQKAFPCAHLDAVQFDATDVYFEFEAENAYAQDITFESLTNGRLPINSENGKTMIIPLKLWMKIMRATFGKDAIEAFPVIGHAKVEKYSDWTRRGVSIPCYFVSMPKEIHHHVTDNKLLWCYHDYLHILTECHNPHRETWVELWKATKKLWPYTDLPLSNMQFPVQILDRGFFDYLNRTPTSDPSLRGQTTQTPEEIRDRNFKRLLEAAQEADPSSLTALAAAICKESKLSCFHGAARAAIRASAAVRP